MKRFGNQYWRNAEYPGQQKRYNGETLWAKFVDYMKYNENISWPREDFIKSGPEAGKLVSIEIPNPPSLMGFTTFAGISLDTLRNYGKSDAELVAVSQAIRDIVMEIQISGAATNMFNATIIARLSGLVDKREVDIKTEMSDDERNEAIKKILENAPKKWNKDDDLL